MKYISELPVLSASRLKTYAVCPKKYKYEYIEESERKTHPAAFIGTVAHRTVEHVYRNGTDPVQTYTDIFATLQQDEFIPNLTIKYQNDGEKMIKLYDFYRRVPNKMEVEFTLAFPSEENPICYIKGFIDQVYEWGFVDLKTSVMKPMAGMLDFDLQFILYHWAFQKLYGERPAHSIWYHMRTAEDIESLCGDNLEYAIKKIQELVSDEKHDRHISDACRYCQFRKPCLGRD